MHRNSCSLINKNKKTKAYKLMLTLGSESSSTSSVLSALVEGVASDVDTVVD